MLARACQTNAAARAAVARGHAHLVHGLIQIRARMQVTRRLSCLENYRVHLLASFLPAAPQVASLLINLTLLINFMAA